MCPPQPALQWIGARIVISYVARYTEARERQPTSSRSKQWEVSAGNSVLRKRHYESMWYRRVGKWLHYMEKTYRDWLHEVELSYHILGLRHTLILKGLQRRTEAPHNTAPSPPQAKRMCTTRKITGRTRASPDAPMHMPDANKTCYR